MVDPVVSWVVAFSAAVTASAVSWVAYAVRTQLREFIEAVEAADQRSREHREVLRDHGADLDPADHYPRTDGGDERVRS